MMRNGKEKLEIYMDGKNLKKKWRKVFSNNILKTSAVKLTQNSNLQIRQSKTMKT